MLIGTYSSPLILYHSGRFNNSLVMVNFVIIYTFFAYSSHLSVIISKNINISEKTGFCIACFLQFQIKKFRIRHINKALFQETVVFLEKIPRGYLNEDILFFLSLFRKYKSYFSHINGNERKDVSDIWRKMKIYIKLRKQRQMSFIHSIVMCLQN